MNNIRPFNAHLEKNCKRILHLQQSRKTGLVCVGLYALCPNFYSCGDANMPQALPKLTFQDLETIDDFVETEKNLISTNDSDSNTKPEIRWVSFDPNVVSAQELIRLGLKDYVAERLVKYRTKGGRFGSMSDLSKIYGIDSEWIKKAEPYAQFEVKAQQTESANQFMISAPDSVAASIPKIELNQAESLELIQVPWIGPYTPEKS